MASASKPSVDLKRRKFVYTSSALFSRANLSIAGTASITSSEGGGTDVAPVGSGAPVKIAGPRLLRKISVEHRALECSRSFERVHRALIESVPALKPEITEMLVRRDEGKIAIARRDWPKLWIFLVRNHGALIAADGQSVKAMQYEIGNPLTAESMTSRVLAAGLYAPLRVILYEDAAAQRAIARAAHEVSAIPNEPNTHITDTRCSPGCTRIEDRAPSTVMPSMNWSLPKNEPHFHAGKISAPAAPTAGGT